MRLYGVEIPEAVLVEMQNWVEVRKVSFRFAHFKGLAIFVLRTFRMEWDPPDVRSRIPDRLADRLLQKFKKEKLIRLEKGQWIPCGPHSGP